MEPTIVIDPVAGVKPVMAVSNGVGDVWPVMVLGVVIIAAALLLVAFRRSP